VVHYTTYAGLLLHQFHWRERLRMVLLGGFLEERYTSRLVGEGSGILDFGCEGAFVVPTG